MLAAARGENLDEPPESVEQLVAVRLDALPAEDRALLRRDAVLGNTFPLRLLTRMLGGHDAGPEDDHLLRSLERLDGFGRGRGRRPARVPPCRAPRGGLRRSPVPDPQVAARAGGGDPRAESGHGQQPARAARRGLLRGGRFEPAWRYARRAGERANERFAPAAAAESFARAAEAARRSPAVPEAERARDLEALGDAQFLCGRSESADLAYHHAGRVLGAHAPSAPGLLLKLAKVAQRQGRYPLALRRLTLGLHGLETSDDAEALVPRARLLAPVGWC